MPKIPAIAMHIGRAGVFAVGNIVENRGHVFREHLTHDFGIDAHVEFCGRDRRPSGHFLALQIKSGPSYFQKRRGQMIQFFLEDRLMRYWKQHLMPVVLVLHDPNSSKLIWKYINDNCVVRVRKRWRVEVPFTNDLDDAAFAELENIASSRANGCPWSPPSLQPSRMVVYQLMNLDSVSGYPFCVTDEARRIFLALSDEHLSFSPEIRGEENQWLNIDYVRTDLPLEFDAAAVVAEIRSCFFETDFSLIARLNSAGDLSAVDLAFGRAEAYYEIELSANAHSATVGQRNGARRAAGSLERDLFLRLAALFAPSFRFMKANIPPG